MEPSRQTTHNSDSTFQDERVNNHEEMSLEKSIVPYAN